MEFVFSESGSWCGFAACLWEICGRLNYLLSDGSHISVQRLAELLKSKKPEDLQEANRLIKNMVKEVCLSKLNVLIIMFVFNYA